MNETAFCVNHTDIPVYDGGIYCKDCVIQIVKVPKTVDRGGGGAGAGTYDEIPAPCDSDDRGPLDGDSGGFPGPSGGGFGGAGF